MRKLILFFLLVLPVSILAQSEATKKLEEDYPRVRMNYIYESVIRTFANVADDEKIMNLVKDVKLIIYADIQFESVHQADSLIKEMIPGLKEEGFEEFIYMEGGNSFFDMEDNFDELGLYIIEEEGEISGLFVCRRQADKLGILDVTGAVDLKNISIEDLGSFNNLMDTFGSNDIFNFGE